MHTIFFQISRYFEIQVFEILRVDCILLIKRILEFLDIQASIAKDTFLMVCQPLFYKQIHIICFG